ncbi:NAD(P)H-flavin reductase/hemoglobin-like flavoprotein [Prauserella isguenensis]|uniref:nitric oxide dioxygenase n=1 Tax=Prauserella isguenensis TaxID=1470180 RepID=A0A839RXE0_9PSEU|nr:FAD-binding oxidoreductase [Prauserella isguenensis]MBB3049825.1 NAD(P)H-flavin reductase/hemoglobin-like flavoprotein [Prauserella isguenensis]
MTAEPLNPIPKVADSSNAPEAVTTMVRHVRETWREIEPYTPEVAQFFYGMLFTLAPEARDFFPIHMDVRSGKLVRAIVNILQSVDRPDDVAPYLVQLGRDHRKFGVQSHHYEAIGTALLAAVKRQLGPGWTDDVERAWAEAFTIVARSMQDAAEADEYPPSWTGTVAEHRRLSWDLALVRIEPDRHIPYRPGQYLSVEVPQRPRLWRNLSPANAPRPDGSIEFHVRAIEGGWVSRGIVSHTQPGDVWRFGAPMGQLHVDRESGRDILMIAGGTGITPLQSILDDLGRYGKNPNVTIFYGGAAREDLYALEVLRSLSATNPWLTVHPVVERDEGLSGFEVGTLADVVSSYGAWADHDVLVSGSPSMIRATVSRMLVAGTALDQIRYDPFIEE